VNKTAIEWCDYTWNPVTGCLHGCPYCYARKIAERFSGSKAWPTGFKPEFHPDRLKDPRKLGTKWNCMESMAKRYTIFVCSMADLFGEWVPARWIWDVFEAMDATPRHTYIMLTKNPERMKSFAPERGDQPRGVKENWWFGVSITGPEIESRLKVLQSMDGNRFVSFEPLLGNPGPLDLTGIKQVIIGAQTNPTVDPDYHAIRSIMDAADCAGAKVFCKDSLLRYLPDADIRRELCWSVHK
jgi:protein gp37